MSGLIARKLRTQQTPAEKALWTLLCNKKLSNYKFRRQHHIGRYIADFACYQQRLIIELDGSQHADNPADRVRTDDLERQGWRVIRFWNHEVLQNREGVLQSILAELASP